MAANVERWKSVNEFALLGWWPMDGIFSKNAIESLYWSIPASYTMRVRVHISAVLSSSMLGTCLYLNFARPPGT